MDTISVAAGTTLTRDIMVYSDASDTTPLNLTGAVVSPAILDAPNGEPITGVHPTAGVTDAPNGQVVLTVDLPDSDGAVHVYWVGCMMQEADSTKTLIDSFRLVVGD